MAYFAVFYEQLKGEDCTCFPWLERVVGPEFFIGDGIMILLAVGAWLRAPPPRGWKPAVAPLDAFAVLSAGFYVHAATSQKGQEAQGEVIFNGEPVSIRHRRVFLYFFGLECCNATLQRSGWASESGRM